MTRSRRRTLVTALTIALGAVVVAAVAFGIALVAGGGMDDQGESLTAVTARAGQCIDLAEEAGRIDITEADCGDPHDAEIVLTTEVSDAIAEPAELDDFEGVCTGLMDPADVAHLAEHPDPLTWGLLIDEPSNIDGFDRLVCYVSSPDGRLDQPLLD